MNGVGLAQEQKVEGSDTALSKTGKLWVFKEADQNHVSEMSLKYGISEMAASISLRRLDSIDDAETMFSSSIKNHLPDPDHLPDSKKAYQSLCDKITADKKIAVWGDYDADGACSCALIIKYFKAIGIDVGFYVPDRFKEGYGPNKEGLKRLADDGAELILIVDCGTTSFDALDWAKDQGIEISIIDHHQTGARHPACHSFINPKRKDYDGPDILRHLCAGGLVFLFLVGFNRFLREKGFFDDKKEPDLYSLLDLVALSTVCDMVPLKGLNRAFVKQGIKVLNKRLSAGLNALSDVIKIRGPLSVGQLGYAIGPRINAGGRIGDSKLGTMLLASSNYEEAIEHARELNFLNQERQRIEKHIEEMAYEKALNVADKPFVMVVGDDWHEGVMGIIAGRIKDAFNKPAIILTRKGDTLKGSARSVAGADIGYMLNMAYDAGILISGGGHPMAGGLSLLYTKFPEFAAFVAKFFETQECDGSFPKIYIDQAITLQAIKSHDFIKSIESLEPFGVANPIPRFLLSGIRFENILPFGNDHFRMRAIQIDGHSYPIVCFRSLGKNIGSWIVANPSCIVDCAVSVTIESNAGLSQANIILEDIR